MPENDELDVELTRYGTIARIITDSEDKLLNEHRSQYFTIDTGFLTPDGFSGMWKWFAGNLHKLVRLSEQIASESVPHRFHRLFIVPDPSEYPNNFQRSLYRRIVQNVLHFHLWHGVVAYVVFIRRSEYDTATMLRASDFGAIGSRVVYDTANYYARTFRGLKIVEGADANSYITRAFGALHSRDVKRVVRLYYDPKTFEHARREDKQWENLRKFFYRLQGGICPGPECARRSTFVDAALDHIIHRNASNNVLLNLRVLCADCNRNKWKSLTHEIPFAAAYEIIPREIATEEIKMITSDSAPPWLHRYNAPPVNILRSLRV
jgi:5-methylcytosine-specific restriction endonuclease McrA